MATILAIGIATLDIINTVDSYPDEDSELRAIAQTQTRGGNATNTLTVLSQLGHQCHWGGVLIDEADSQFILDDLASSNINISACKRLPNGKMPTSYITLSQQTGSRSIVHHRDCPEYSFDDFKLIDLTQFDWIHFEGRNIDDTLLMLQHLKQYYPNTPCSIEIEKPRSDIEQLFEHASILMFSQHYAQAKGFETATDLLNSLANNISATCTRGEQGAWAVDKNGIHHSKVTIPTKIIDTLGAGDTFNAALIHSLVNNNELQYALDNACKLASHKCGQQGFSNLTQNIEL